MRTYVLQFLHILYFNYIVKNQFGPLRSNYALMLSLSHVRRNSVMHMHLKMHLNGLYILAH